MRRNMIEWLEEIRIAEQKKGMPVLSFPAIQKMNITVKELVESDELQAEAMKIVADMTPDSLASVSMMDLSVEAEAFGSEIRYSDDEVPTVIGRIVEDEKEAEQLEIPNVGAGRTGIYVEAMAKAVKTIQNRPVFAGVIGPFSLAGRLMDVTEAMVNCYEDPDMVHLVLEKVTEFLIQYINAYKEAGANGVVMAEPLAGILSPGLEKEFSSEYVKRIVDAVQTEEFLVIYHNCGNNIYQQIDSIVENGCHVLHFGNAVDMKLLLDKIPEDRIVMGNVDPAGQFRNGTPESVKQATMELLEKCAEYSNFIISSGCDIPPSSSWNNIQAFFDGIKEFYRA